MKFGSPVGYNASVTGTLGVYNDPGTTLAIGQSQFTAVSAATLTAGNQETWLLSSFAYPSGTSQDNFHSVGFVISGGIGNSGTVSVLDENGLTVFKATLDFVGLRATQVLPLLVGSGGAGQAAVVVDNTSGSAIFEVDVILSQLAYTGQLESSGATIVDGSGSVQPVSQSGHFLVQLLDKSSSNEGAIDAQGGLSVAGEAAVGNPPTGNPVSVAGWDGTDTRRLLTDILGGLLSGRPSGLTGVSVFTTPAAGSSTTIVSAVAGETITVYGYVLSFAPSSKTATTGTYDCALADSSGVNVGLATAELFSDASSASWPLGPIWIPCGYPVTTGDALDVSNLSTSAGPIDIRGVVWYTQH